VAELVVTQDVNAPAQRVWSALVDWELHGEWMLLTRASGGAAVGESIEAFTGIGRFGFLDRMTIVAWEPPHRAVVRHTGRVLRGSGAFEVRELAPQRSTVVWSEWIDLPLGALGRAGWPLVRPIVGFGVSFSLRRLARYVEADR
jgi:Polyketide cyclase / dehydrase and lipid transport